MFANTGIYMCTFIGRVLWVCGFARNASWIQGNPQFTGAMPIKDMLGYHDSVIVADGSGVLWHCGLPTGEWVQDIPQPPFTFKEFMGSGTDENYNWYVAAPAAV